MKIETKRAERHIQALNLAKECAELGARFRTIVFVTGLTQRTLHDLFFQDGNTTPRGRAPDSPDWYHSANLLNRVEASIVVSLYRRIRNLGFGPPHALTHGYRQYREACDHHPRISFDRAFDLVSHVDGIWLSKVINLSLLSCPACSSHYVAAVGAEPISNRECPFCRLVSRYERDPRIQAAFPVRAHVRLDSLDDGLPTLFRQIEEMASLGTTGGADQESS